MIRAQATSDDDGNDGNDGNDDDDDGNDDDDDNDCAAGAPIIDWK